MAKIIIGIHGLGNKPPEDILSAWWKLAIAEGLRDRALAVPDFEFKLLYWADILHPEPMDLNDIANKSRLYVPEVYPPIQPPPHLPPMDFRKKAVDYLARYYEKIWAEGLLPLNKPAITDLFIHLHLKDLKAYYSPDLVNHSDLPRLTRDVISERVLAALRLYRDKDIMVIAHSMGSLILHDALMTSGNEVRIDTLVTIGSPLAQNYVISRMQAESIEIATDKLAVPNNIISKWLNLSDLEDQIAINYRLGKFYKPNEKGVSVEDIIVQNIYVSNGIINPHSSFGYLRTREMAEALHTFLTYKKPGFFMRLWNKIWTHR